MWEPWYLLMNYHVQFEIVIYNIKISTHGTRTLEVLNWMQPQSRYIYV